MAAAHALMLLGVFLAIVAVALFLIVVTFQLHMVHSRLNVILGVVVDVGNKTQPLDGVVSDITNDLVAGAAAVDQAIDRLAQRKGVERPSPTGEGGAEAPMPKPATVPGPPPITFNKY